MIIKCYRVYSEFANVWDSIVLNCPSPDQIYDEIDVVLPDGYTYVTNECGENQVIAPNGSACELTLNSIGGQVIIAWTARGGKALRRATRRSGQSRDYLSSSLRTPLASTYVKSNGWSWGKRKRAI